jgi:uncharacterized membrane protein
VSYTHIMYALHSLAVLIGVTSMAFIATGYVFGVPSIIAVIMNFIRRDKVRGTWLASHFTWLWRTFWWAFLWVALIWLALGPFVLIFITAPVKFGYLLVGIWLAYRVARGWLALRDGRTMPVKS